MNAVVDALRTAGRIALVSHRDPDPDTIGSSLALGLALERMGKQVSWHCADPVPEAIRFLAAADRVTQAPPPRDVDLIVCLDFGEPERAKFALPAGPRIADIDHHATNTAFGDANFVDVTSVETTADLKTAKVFVSVLGDADAVASTMQALNEARPFIRREVGERTDLRFVPQIEFVSDTSAARAARISQLLREATRDR